MRSWIPKRPALLLISTSALVFFPGCEDAAKDFRKILRGAAASTSRSSGIVERGANGKQTRPSKSGIDDSETGSEFGSEDSEDTAATRDKSARNARDSGKGIKQCPEGAKLTGDAPPLGVAQFCIARTKDGREVRHGEYRRWHNNGNLKELAFFKFGKADGLTKSFYPSGVTKESTEYSEGLPHGAFNKFYKDGTKQYYIEYQDGQKHGRFESYSKDSLPREKGSYFENEKSGPWKKFHSNGQINTLVTFRGGQKNGKTESYSSEGTLLESGEFRENLPSGRWTEYYKDGEKKSEGTFSKGQRDGQWTLFQRDGSVQKIMVYQDGSVIDQQKPSTARASLGRPKSKRSKSSSFGAKDTLGAEAPIPDRGVIVVSPPTSSQPSAEQTPERGGWKPM